MRSGLLAGMGAAILASGAATTSPAEAHEASEWFYVVKSRSTDPAREADYNRWYDEIDIPDVLEVPSFVRARRAVAADRSAQSVTRPEAQDGDYVALYDVVTHDIDNAIIDLYVAARRMTARGRITDLLDVTEANYYRRLASLSSRDHAPGATGAAYFVQKILCCNDAEQKRKLADWFARDLRSALDGLPGLRRADLYDLYRVMEVEALTAGEVPHMLAVYEFDTQAANNAHRLVRERLNRMRASEEIPSGFNEGADSAVYLEHSDVSGG